jgi:GDP-L-fucose synthase
VLLLKSYSADRHVNVGSGEDVTILELAETIAGIVGFTGEIRTDPSKPDGTPRKLMDASVLLATGWRPRYDLKGGLADAYGWFRRHLELGDARLSA